ncbi:hypothetical protein C5S31_09450 [ANME-1 cluster archaeon GoMg2]|nr:hypothetical protein [ANME-1 cluster archaeon GoMg2]
MREIFKSGSVRGLIVTGGYYHKKGALWALLDIWVLYPKATLPYLYSGVTRLLVVSVNLTSATVLMSKEG